MDSERIKRVSILRVPVDILAEEDIEEVVRSMFSDGRNHQIVLLSLWDLMKARRSADFRTMVNGASLVIPISLSIVRAARFLRRAEPARYMPFEFVIKLLNVLDRWNKTVYLFGGTRKTLTRTEKNIRDTYPNVRIVGRYHGYYPRAVEPAIVEAVRKATPTLLLVGQGVPGHERWIPRSMKSFNAGIYLWCSNLFDVFAERVAKPSKALFDRGLEWIPFVLRHPWKLFRAFTFMRFKLLLLWYRIRKL
ncbi:MAG: WecB/TagA/CpsF family glycosyltransferase [Spirochaetes bacterium]|nr:WecB/TagA/CpsF family glycosyltransferase [Spirochaetota bacterium]